MESGYVTDWGRIRMQGHIVWVSRRGFSWWYDVTPDRPDADRALALVHKGPFPDQDVAIDSAKRDIEFA